MLPYQDTIGKKIGLSWQGKLVHCVKQCHWFMFVTSLPCFCSNQLLFRADGWSKSQLQPRGFSLLLQLCHQKGNLPFLCPCPSPNFVSTQEISNLTPLNGGKKNAELSRALLGLCFSNSLF